VAKCRRTATIEPFLHSLDCLRSVSFQNCFWRAFLTCIRYNAICSTAAAAGGSVEGASRKKKKKKAKGDKGELAAGAGGDEGGKKKRKKRGGSDSGSGSGGDGDSWYGGEEFDDLIDDRSGLRS
jgi:hypothetical protein